jgi:hypothetical protein
MNSDSKQKSPAWTASSLQSMLRKSYDSNSNIVTLEKSVIVIHSHGNMATLINVQTLSLTSPVTHILSFRVPVHATGISHLKTL